MEGGPIREGGGGEPSVTEGNKRVQFHAWAHIQLCRGARSSGKRTSLSIVFKKKGECYETAGNCDAFAAFLKPWAISVLL